MRDGWRAYSVPDTLARELAAAGDDAGRRWRSLVGEPAAAPSGRSFRLRVGLLTAARADAVARRLAPLASNRGLSALILIGAAGLGIARFVADLRPAAADGDVALGVGFFLVTAFWHEFGHAAAMRHEGLPAGRIGGGLLWVLPVLTCDVTATALLPRRGRLRVDGAGMVFQFAAAGALAGLAGHWAPARIGANLALAAVAWNIVPLLRTDGHWLLLDLVELPDLTAALPREWPASCRALLAAWRVATGAALATAVVWLPWRVDHWLVGAGDATWLAGAVPVLRGLLWLLAALVGRRAGRRAWALIAAVLRDRR